MNGLTAYHVVWCTHNSRYSEKLFKLGVKKGSPVILSNAMRNAVAGYLESKIRTAGYKVISLNVMSDHVHCIIVSSEDEIERTVGQLKGYSSYMLHKTGRLQPPVQLSTPGRLQPPVTPQSEHQHVWAKKFSKTYIDSEEALIGTVKYVEQNHLKHGILPLTSPFSNWSDEDACKVAASPVATPISEAFGHTDVPPHPTGGGLKTAVATLVGDGLSNTHNGAASAPLREIKPLNGAASAPLREIKPLNGVASAPRNA